MIGLRGGVLRVDGQGLNAWIAWRAALAFPPCFPRVSLSVSNGDIRADVLALTARLRGRDSNPDYLIQSCPKRLG